MSHQLVIEQPNQTVITLIHETPVISYVVSDKTGRVISYAQDGQLYVWDLQSSELLAKHNALDDFYVTNDGQWLLMSEMIDYGNGQDQSIYIAYIGNEQPVNSVDSWCIHSYICDGIDMWFTDDGTLWTEGEYNKEVSSPGNHIYDRKQYHLQYREGGCVDLELLKTMPTDYENYPADDGFLVFESVT